MPESYLFLRINDEPAFGIVYTFTTPKFGFRVYFNDWVYKDLIQEYKYLSEKSYSFGFLPTDLAPDARKKQDVNIGCTIISIVEDFFALEGDETVILFHCDSKDSRQYARHITFGKWYDSSIIQDVIKMYSHKVPVGDVDHYLGFICHVNNKNRDQLIKEFEKIAKKLAPPEPGRGK